MMFTLAPYQVVKEISREYSIRQLDLQFSSFCNTLYITGPVFNFKNSNRNNRLKPIYFVFLFIFLVYSLVFNDRGNHGPYFPE